MTRRSVLLLATALATALPASLGAHPHEQLTAERQGAIEQQVMAVRARLAEAVRAKDVVALRALYAPGFTHTHGSGKVDGRDARLVALLAGEPVIELAPVEELTIRIPHADTAIVTGRSPVLNMTESRNYDFRWMQVYVRVGGEWQIAASQATRLGPSV
ncbi:MAG: nuclear transport factor 2 family protein [Acetobacteraceae bacterium]|nr:nuclear transport factor 2 family protein [Acetobacteraceae bacterium]